MATSKYNALREIFQKINKHKLPEVPKPIKVIKIPAIEFSKVNCLFDLTDHQKPVISDKPLTFEDLNLGNGYMLYRRKFDKDQKGKLEIKGLRDYANIYINGKWKGEMNRIHKKYDLDLEIKPGDRLEILVENMGRINYGAEIVHNLKGIISPVKMNGIEMVGNWEMLPLPFDTFPKHHFKNKDIAHHSPVIQEAEFTLDETGDTFLDMRNFGKGIVFINGKNAGRYWSTAGPQQTLYIPGVWLKKGKNLIQIFEQIEFHSTVSGIDHPILDQLVK